MATTFTPMASLAGGMLIGTAAVLLMLFLGRIAGATGILAGIFFPSNASDWTWRVAMVAGMLGAPAVYHLLVSQPPSIEVPVSGLSLAVGGVIVGVGVTLGSGCTSGHGVCGLARLSVRSLVAVLTFMAATGVTVYVTRHVLGG